MDANPTIIIYSTPYGYRIVYRDGGFHCDAPTNPDRDAHARANAQAVADLHGNGYADAGTADGDAAPAVSAAL